MIVSWCHKLYIHTCTQARFESTDSGLKQILAELIPEKQKEVKEFRQQHGGFGMGEVTIDQVNRESLAYMYKHTHSLTHSHTHTHTHTLTHSHRCTVGCEVSEH